jgi:hypothetical protein
LNLVRSSLLCDLLGGLLYTQLGLPQRINSLFLFLFFFTSSTAAASALAVAALEAASCSAFPAAAFAL